jgi:uncharacterized protein YjbI with pentapeptide repeats
MTTTVRDRLLAEAYFEGESFLGLELGEADLSRKEFQSCTFRNVKLPSSRWMGALLEDCTFELCDLSNFSPKGLATRDVTFSECKLIGVDWTGVSPHPRIAFEACDLRYAAFASAHLRKTPFRRSQITGATFVDVDLTECDFDGSDLAGTTFRECVLHKADFSGARGVLLDPAKNRVKDARISLDAAALLAASFGLRVAGYAVGEPASSGAPRAQRARGRRSV